MKKTFKSIIMDFVESKGGVIRRTDLVKFIVEYKGMTFDPIAHRGFYSCALQVMTKKWSFLSHSYIDCQCNDWEIGYLMKPSKVEHRHLHRISRGIYKLEY